MGNQITNTDEPLLFYGPFDRITTTIMNVSINEDRTFCKRCKLLNRNLHYMNIIPYNSDEIRGNMLIIEGDIIAFNTPPVKKCTKCNFELVPELIHESRRGFMFACLPNSKIKAIYSKCPITAKLEKRNFHIAAVPNFGIIIRLMGSSFPYILWLDDRNATCETAGYCELAEINNVITGCFVDSNNQIHVINSTGNVLAYETIKQTAFHFNVATYAIDKYACLTITSDFKDIKYISSRPATKTKAAIHSAE